jgi:transposase IS4-like protein/DDE family transposase
LTLWCPPELVDKVIDACGRREQRRRLLSARTLVYFEFARCLYPSDGYRQVFEHLLPDDADDGWGRPVQVPNKSSLCKARRKLGPEVLEAVFHQVAGPIANEATCPAAFWRHLRLEAFDPTVLDVADTPANEAAFGRPAGGDGAGGYPQARVVALIECGTHALCDAVIGGRGRGETTLAMALAASAGPGTLVLADRLMFGVGLWRAFTNGGAHLLWRLEQRTARRVVQVLDDGSYLARVRVDKHTDAALRRQGLPPVPHLIVRVIEYTLPGSEEVYRLATSLLDPASAPAVELAVLYHQRWESEGLVGEVKTAQRGARTVLRSATP